MNVIRGQIIVSKSRLPRAVPADTSRRDVKPEKQQYSEWLETGAGYRAEVNAILVRQSTRITILAGSLVAFLKLPAATDSGIELWRRDMQPQIDLVHSASV
jgi:hypothetical protein